MNFFLLCVINIIFEKFFIYFINFVSLDIMLIVLIFLLWIVIFFKLEFIIMLVVFIVFFEMGIFGRIYVLYRDFVFNLIVVSWVICGICFFWIELNKNIFISFKYFYLCFIYCLYFFLKYGIFYFFLVYINLFRLVVFKLNIIREGDLFDNVMGLKILWGIGFGICIMLILFFNFIFRKNVLMW